MIAKQKASPSLFSVQEEANSNLQELGDEQPEGEEKDRLFYLSCFRWRWGRWGGYKVQVSVASSSIFGQQSVLFRIIFSF
jgi:hypothetical protein